MTKSSSPTSTRQAGLIYGSDHQPGIGRKHKGRRIVYVSTRGREIRDAGTLARIRQLAIPPAWTDVWIAPRANQHLQATGRDAKGRKQYKYHAKWREQRDSAKFDNLVSFARALPKIRRRLAHDLRAPGLGREKVLALIVPPVRDFAHSRGQRRICPQQSFLRLDHYARSPRHDRGRSRAISFSRQERHIARVEPTFATPRSNREALPGVARPGAVPIPRCSRPGARHHLGGRQRISTLHFRRDITAKDFRTWAGTWLAAQALREFTEFDSEAAAKRNITRAIERVAARLGNTPTICRKCYVHPGNHRVVYRPYFVAHIAPACADGSQQVPHFATSCGGRCSGTLARTDEAAIEKETTGRLTKPARIFCFKTDWRRFIAPADRHPRARTHQ